MVGLVAVAWIFFDIMITMFAEFALFSAVLDGVLLPSTLDISNYMQDRLNKIQSLPIPWLIDTNLS